MTEKRFVIARLNGNKYDFIQGVPESGFSGSIFPLTLKEAIGRQLAVTSYAGVDAFGTKMGNIVVCELKEVAE